ncbi:MAG: radical SAM protein [Bacteroidales bacterium]
MKILLVGNPRTVKGFNRLTKLPSLNLASLAAHLPDGVEVKVADLVLFQKNAENKLSEIVKGYQPDLVGFTAMSFQYATALKLISRVKHESPRSKIVLGGYHATAEAENILRSEEGRMIDWVVVGEGEEVFRQLVEALADKKDVSGVPGLALRENDSIRINPRPQLLQPEQIRLPDRQARIFRKGFHIMGIPGDVIETSRGCVFDCNFCSIRNMYGKSFRKFSVDRVLADLEDARRYGARSIFITDDNITIDGKRLESLCKSIASSGLKMTFAVQASVSGIKRHPQLVKAMAEAGVKIIFLGIESITDEALAFMKKKNQMAGSDVEGVVRNLKNHGILVVGGFIFGYPEDRAETMRNNFEFAKRLRIDIPLFNILTPHPATPLRDELLQLGLVTNANDYTRYNHYFANVRTHHLSDEELFSIRNRYDARYPLESGALWRLFKFAPVHITRMLLTMLADEPKNWINFAKGPFTKM